MTNDKKQEYTRRITNANISELTVILCDMFIDYCQDANCELKANNISGYKENILKARRVLSELIQSLDRSLEISGYVYELYRYVERMLIKADIRFDEECVIQSIGIIKRLNDAYREISQKDESDSLMSNAEEVYAGMTYGRYDVSSQTVPSNRGFFA